MKSKKIVLIGFMCCGKTTCGFELSKALNVTFVDTDQLIQNKAKLDVPCIFEKYGEHYFRKLEKEALLHVSTLENVVVSCGGGAVKHSEQFKILKQGSVVIYLKANVDKIHRNCQGKTDRPLLMVDDVYGTIKNLLAEREPLYLINSDIQIDVSNMEVSEVVFEIIKRLRNYEAYKNN